MRHHTETWSEKGIQKRQTQEKGQEEETETDKDGNEAGDKRV